MKQNKFFSILTLTVGVALAFNSCKKPQEETPPSTTNPPASGACVPASSYTPGTGPNLVFKFVFDSTQQRLNSFGVPVGVGSGNAAQNPRNFSISQHYIELAGDFDPVGSGQVLYTGPSTTAGGGSAAIDYCASTVTGQNVVFFAKKLSTMTPGTYKWLRISLAEQNYNIVYKSQYLPGNQLGTGTLASFI